MLIDADAPLDGVRLCSIAATSTSAILMLPNRDVVVGDVRDIIASTPLRLAAASRVGIVRVLDCSPTMCFVDAKICDTWCNACFNLSLLGGPLMRVACLWRLPAGANVGTLTDSSTRHRTW